jgi:dTDP-4-dehydrorhamnose reductase
MKLFTDEFRCPIPAVETARAVWDLANQTDRAFPPGGRGKTVALANRPNACPTLAASQNQNHIRFGQRIFPGPPRALDTSLNITKVQEGLSVPLPGLTGWLAANPDEQF